MFLVSYHFIKSIDIATFKKNLAISIICISLKYLQIEKIL